MIMRFPNLGLLLGGCLFLLLAAFSALGQSARTTGTDGSFGPNVTAYLRYLKDEEEVVDDPISRPEIKRQYYVRNMNRIKALREVALRIARSSDNDFIPELEAVAPDELHTLFEQPPDLNNMKAGEVLNDTFRYWGKVRTGMVFYIFVRLDPYEQADMIEKERRAKAAAGLAGTGGNVPTTPQKVDKSP
jgi:hypothetical protein